MTNNSSESSAAKNTTMSSPVSKESSSTDTLEEPKASLVVDEEKETEDETEGLLGRTTSRHFRRGKRNRTGSIVPQQSTKDRIRPYWLGMGLFLILFSFWLLDSLKDPVFGVLVNGNLDQHQPPAKLLSVVSTLALVCFLEYLSQARKQQQQQETRTEEDVLDGGGHWTRMSTSSATAHSAEENEDDDDGRVPVIMFAYVGVSYMVLFTLLAYVVTLHPSFARSSSFSTATTPRMSSSLRAAWHVLAYIYYATIESFGSLSVATFWSYTNSTLTLEYAERYYGVIIAIAQLGAIGGSSIVTYEHVFSTFSLILLAVVVMALQVGVMLSYHSHYTPATMVDGGATPTGSSSSRGRLQHKVPAAQAQQPHSEEPWSGVYLILQHNYVLLILGVSCLYEVSLTVLDYQMKLLGWARFEEESVKMTFAQFMGRYGQLTNISSLFFSYVCFPFFIQRLGLRWTMRIFPTLLLMATLLQRALPGNLALLFVSMSLLKAMTYSIHDPSKEILYLPTSNPIKFRAKFWIDIVGARVAKAVGSTLNATTGSVEQSVRVGSLPSILTAASLWWVCYRAGIQFDKLIATQTIVGVNDEDGGGRASSLRYAPLSTVSEEEIQFGDPEEDGLLLQHDDEEEGSAADNVELVKL